jgi:hypothetical protein
MVALVSSLAMSPQLICLLSVQTLYPEPRVCGCDSATKSKLYRLMLPLTFVLVWWPILSDILLCCYAFYFHRPARWYIRDSVLMVSEGLQM